MTKNLPATVESRLAEAADAYASEETTRGGLLISTRGGILRVGEDEMPGNQMCVVILDAIRENTYYTEKFDAQHTVPPVCYAYGRKDSEMAPEVGLMDQTDPTQDWFEPQAESCAECPLNEWGSAERGRGKACANRRRLLLVPAGFYSPIKRSRDFELEVLNPDEDTPESEIAEIVEHYQEADMATLKIPVTSVKSWSKYVKKLGGLNRPPFGVLTRVSLEPHAQYQFELKFEMIEAASEHIIEALIARHEEARSVIEQPYQPPREDQEDRDDRGSRGLKGLKKKKAR